MRPDYPPCRISPLRRQLSATLRWASRRISMTFRILVAFLTASYALAGYADDAGIFPYTQAGIRQLSNTIQSVSLIKQIDGKTFLVELEINKDPFVGGAQDWNSVSSDVFGLSKKLLGRPETARISFKFRSPQNNNFDWANVFVRREKLPKNWDELTYHQFFGRSEPLPGNIQTTKWLCDYYNKYHSSQPPTGIPFFCKLKD